MPITVQNARRGKLRLAHGVQLKPGPNSVDPDSWAKCRDHPVTRYYVQRGEVVAVVAVVPGPAKLLPTVVERESVGTGPGIRPSNSDTVPEFTPTQALPSVRADAHACEPVSATRHPETLNAKAAAREVRLYTSVAALACILETETRSTVRKAAERRIAELGG